MDKKVMQKIDNNDNMVSNNNDSNFFQSRNVRTSFVILILIVVSLSATYAYLSINSTNTTSPTQAGCFIVNYKGQSINNTALQSTNDYTQGEVSEIVLSKNSDCEIYTEASIYMHTNIDDTNAPLENGALKYKIMSGAKEISSGAIEVVATGDDDQLLATVELTPTDTTYTVYLWIDSEISKGSYNGKTYSGYIYASSTQTSTIK